MKTALSVLLVFGCAVLASAQATAPAITSLSSPITRVQAERTARAVDGSMRLRGGVKYGTLAHVDIEAEEIDITKDGRVLVIRGGATVTLRPVVP